jgi:hypothetical protein
MVYKKPTPAPQGYKYCSRDSECINPDGPLLPATLEYFKPSSQSKDGMRGVCRVCHRAMVRQWSFDKLSDEQQAERLLEKHLDEQGLKRCSSGDDCLTEGGPILPATTEYFNPKRSGKYGLHFRCIKCERDHAARQRHPDDYDEWKAEFTERQKPIPDGYKWCSKGNDCVHPQGPILPATTEFFYADRGLMSGLKSYCKACAPNFYVSRLSPEQQELKKLTEELAQQGLKRCSNGDACVHPDGPVLPATTDYFYKRVGKLAPVCKPCGTEYTRKHNAKPEIAAREYKRRKERNSKPETKARLRQWKENGGKTLASLSQTRRRARVLNLPDTFMIDDWRYALEYFNGCCAVCGRQLNDLFGEHYAAADHWIPISSPNCPGTIPENMVPLCHGVDGCNNAKSATEPYEWLIRRFGKRKAGQINTRIQAFFATVRRSV